MASPQRLGKIVPPIAAPFRHSFADLAEQGVPRCFAGTEGILLACRVCKEGLDRCFCLPRRIVEVQAQNVQDPEERPDLRRRESSPLALADDRSDLVTVPHGLGVEEPGSGQPVLELGPIASGPRTIEEPRKVLEKRVCSPECHQSETIGGCREQLGVLEVIPEIKH
jgi:hypothetical protein